MLVDINKIKVEKRIRKAYGDIEGLATSIRELGLLNPPVVTPDFELVAGERRLKALKHLNYQQIEVNVMTFEDYETKFRAEIEENEQRLEFTFSERMEWARELEQIERGKSKERQSTMNNGEALMENFPQASQGATRDIVADQVGFGSGKQYEKAKFIVDNADPELIKQLDEEQISVHAAYQRIKKEKEVIQKELDTAQQERQTALVTLESVKANQREINSKAEEVKIKIVDNTDYDAIIRLEEDLEKQKKNLEKEKKEYVEKYRDSLTELNEKNAIINKFMGESTNFQIISQTSENTLKMMEFIREMSKYDYLSDVFNEIPDATRKEYVRSIYGVYKWARSILQEVRHDDVVGIDKKYN